MGDYVYKCPTEDGMKMIKLSKKQHKNLFKHDKLHWTYTHEYYISDEKIVIHKLSSKTIIILALLFLPFPLIVDGVTKVAQDYKDLLNEKKYGSFVSKTIWRNDKTEYIWGELGYE